MLNFDEITIKRELRFQSELYLLSIILRVDWNVGVSLYNARLASIEIKEWSPFNSIYGDDICFIVSNTALAITVWLDRTTDLRKRRQWLESRLLLQAAGKGKCLIVTQALALFDKLEATVCEIGSFLKKL